MSIAFVREPEGGEAFEDLPDRPIPPHDNFVTPHGLALIERTLEETHAAHAALAPDDKAGASRLSRDLRYWTARRNTAQVIPPSAGEVVQFGSSVTIARDDDHRQTFRIVGEDEADPTQGTLSYVSPLARALTGKSRGDVVEVAGRAAEIVEVA